MHIESEIIIYLYEKKKQTVSNSILVSTFIDQ